MQPPWWQAGSVYQIYPRSFADGNGDGVGDLAGLVDHLDHLAWLGVDALWLSPVYPSPMADFGYDVADYCDVDPVFGDLDALDRLVAEAHGRDIRVVLDWVPNHTSDQHPWFRSAIAGRGSQHRDWYVWRDPAPGGGPPNNWVRSWSTEPAWTYDPNSGQYYLHCFLPEQPDLNWSEPQVEAAMHDVLRFWLDRGIDGFRADVVHLIGKDPHLPDDPDDLAALSHVVLNDRPETHEHLRRIRKLLDSYDGDRMMVGEVYLLDTERVASYYGDNDELHLSFNFLPLYSPWSADAWRGLIADVERTVGGRGGWPTWVLSNHDGARFRTRVGGNEARTRAAAVLLLGLRGTPFLFAGEELGLPDAVIPPERAVDPGGRDGCRAPIPWTTGAGHGWSTDPWLPFVDDAATLSVEAQRSDETSVLHLYRRLLRERRDSPALSQGTVELLDTGPDTLGLLRRRGDEQRAVIVNFGHEERFIDDLRATVLVSSCDVDPDPVFSGRLGPDEAVLVDPGR